MASKVSEQLLNPTDPATLATLRLQISMERAFQQQQQKFESEQQEHATASARAAVAVTSIRPSLAGSLEEYESALQQVLDYIILEAGLAAGSEQGRAEVAAAVESVFPLAGVARFLTLTADERAQQLESLAHIALGICQYNSSKGLPCTALAPGAAATAMAQAQKLQRELQKAVADAKLAAAWCSSSSSKGGSSGSSSSRRASSASSGGGGNARYGSSNGRSSSSSGVKGGAGGLGTTSSGPAAAGGAARGGSGGGAISAGVVSDGVMLFVSQVWAYVRGLLQDLEGGMGAAQELQQELQTSLAEVRGLREALQKGAYAGSLLYQIILKGMMVSLGLGPGVGVIITPPPVFLPRTIWGYNSKLGQLAELSKSNARQLFSAVIGSLRILLRMLTIIVAGLQLQ